MEILHWLLKWGLRISQVCELVNYNVENHKLVIIKFYSTFLLCEWVQTSITSPYKLWRLGLDLFCYFKAQE